MLGCIIKKHKKSQVKLDVMVSIMYGNEGSGAGGAGRRDITRRTAAAAAAGRRPRA